MFGKKKQQGLTPSLALPPDFSSDIQEQDDPRFNNQNFGFQQPMQQPQPQIQQMQPQMNPQMNPQYQQPIQPQIQQPQMQYKAEIIRIEKSDTDFVYVVVTNYPLMIGKCRIEN